MIFLTIEESTNLYDVIISDNPISPIKGLRHNHERNALSLNFLMKLLILCSLKNIIQAQAGKKKKLS